MLYYRSEVLLSIHSFIMVLLWSYNISSWIRISLKLLKISIFFLIFHSIKIQHFCMHQSTKSDFLVFFSCIFYIALKWTLRFFSLQYGSLLLPYICHIIYVQNLFFLHFYICHIYFPLTYICHIYFQILFISTRPCYTTWGKDKTQEDTSPLTSVWHWLVLFWFL